MTVHLCTPGHGQGVVDRLTLIQGLAHAWVTENVDPTDREGFIASHGLETWEGAETAWARLGVE